MKTIKSLIPYVLVTIAAFYLLPLFISDTGTGIILLLCIIPAICIFTAFIYGMKSSVNAFVLPIITALLFIPSIFIFFNHSAWIYPLVYGAISLVCALLGRFVNNIF